MQIDSILRHCYVMSPKDYKNSSGEGDDVFFCEYEYNEQWCKFKRIEYLDDNVSRLQCRSWICLEFPSQPNAGHPRAIFLQGMLLVFT